MVGTPLVKWSGLAGTSAETKTAVISIDADRQGRMSGEVFKKYKDWRGRKGGFHHCSGLDEATTTDGQSKSNHLWRQSTNSFAFDPTSGLLNH